MWKLLIFSSVFLIGVGSSEVSLIFDRSEIVVNPGEQFNLDCGVRGISRTCLWESEGDQIYQVEDVYSNIYEGISKPENNEGNECGIVINSATTQHHGRWTCKVLVVGNTLVGNKNVIVTVKPTSPILEIENQRVHDVRSGEESVVKCSVAAARPAVTMRWLLGEHDISVSAETEETPADTKGIYKSISTLRRTFQPVDNGKTLTCSISHKTLMNPENASVSLNVNFKPDEKPLTTFYQISPGSDYELRFNVSANPQPTKLEWRFGESFENPNIILPIPGQDERFTSAMEDLGGGMYTVKLFIPEFNEEDAKADYSLIVENILGETQYKIKLSVDEAPADGVTDSSNHDKTLPSEYVFDDETKSNALSGGAVAGIIIVLLVIVVALCAAAYARYRQMFCFAPVITSDPEEGRDDKEEHSDTESARGTAPAHTATIKTRLGHLTQVFSKPKKEQDTKPEDNEKFLSKDNTKDNSYPEHDTDNKEVVYAELDLGKGDNEKKGDVKSEDKTEYAQIVGTLTDNREEEKKE